MKNADLLTHFRSFIRENPEREKNRELFKRFVNSLATVQQVDGVSYVVLRKKFRGNVPGGGEQGSRVAPGKKREVSPGNGAQSPAGRAAKPRQTPQLLGGTPGKQVLPAAGFILSDVETNSNLSQQPVTSRFEDSIRPAAAQLVNLTSGQCQAPPQAHVPNVGQHIRGAGHPLETTPVKIAADNHMQVPATFRGQPSARQALSQAGVSTPPQTSGRQALLQAGLNPPPQTTSRHRHRQSYKSAVSHDDDDDAQEDTPVRPISAGRHAPHGNPEKALFASPPSNIDSPVPSSSSSSSSEKKLPQIYIQNANGKMLSNTGLSWRSESDRQTEEWLVPGLEYGSVPWQMTRRSLPEEVRCYSPDPANEVPSAMSQMWVQPAGGCLEPRLHHNQRSGLSSSHSSIFTPSPGVGITRGLHCNSSLEELHSRPGTIVFSSLKGLALSIYLKGILDFCPVLLSGKTGVDLGLQETLQLTQRNKLDVTRHSSDHLHVDQEPLSWHRSTGLSCHLRTSVMPRRF